MKRREKLLPYSSGKHYEGKSTQQVFSEIFENKTWQLEQNGSLSGPGSSLLQTQELINQLPQVLKNLGVKSMLDIPCGDFGWMQNVPLGPVKYVGADIVPTLIDEHQKKFSNNHRTFIRLDLIEGRLPEVDFIFCRDCLVHLSFQDIFLAIRTLKKSKAEFIMLTHFPDEITNMDIITGGWRPLNFCIHPFYFPQPTLMIEEKCTEMDGAFQDKSMALWRVSSLP